MLDIRRRQGAAHRWRYFLYRMTAVCVGLLLAIALEQSVEGLHRWHERGRLEDDLRAELEQNQAEIRNDVMVLDDQMVWLTSWNAAVQDARDRGVPLKQEMTEDGFEKSVRHTAYALPSMSVWSVAQHAMRVGLLPRNQAEAFERISAVQERMLDGAAARMGIYRERVAFEARFTYPYAPTVPECSKMKPEELNEYSALLMREFQAVRMEELYQLYLYGANGTVLRGRYSGDEINAGMRAAGGDLWMGPWSNHSMMERRP